ncbi:hypothetical protein [uncultured Deinococcus sp.]|uniref:hypothetical protein n=1 Tax=uncultured Deinococcus sp. TaxID=158789 RepID=UPI0025F4FE36|nr:hypothetical protein [uncultured Deinococcus sp.]
MTHPTAPMTSFSATLYLEVRSRGSRPGTVATERRVYTLAYDVDPAQDVPCRLHMVHRHGGHGYEMQSIHTWDPAAYDLEAHTATFRESMKASDPLLGRLERFGWQRRSDLEAR